MIQNISTVPFYNLNYNENIKNNQKNGKKKKKEKKENSKKKKIERFLCFTEIETYFVRTKELGNKSFKTIQKLEIQIHNEIQNEIEFRITKQSKGKLFIVFLIVKKIEGKARNFFFFFVFQKNEGLFQKFKKFFSYLFYLISF